MKAVCLRLKKPKGISFELEPVTEIRQSHQPDDMFDVLVAADPEGCPAGIGNPAVLFGEIVPKKEVMNGTRKRNVHVAAKMHMTDFRLSKSVFLRREPMRMRRNPWPR